MEYADKVNGVVYNTLNIAIAAPESEDFQLKISPMCASGWVDTSILYIEITLILFCWCTGQEDLGIFLPIGTINQLGLVPVGDFETRSYGRVQTFSGLLFRLEAPRSEG